MSKPIVQTTDVSSCWQNKIDQCSKQKIALITLFVVSLLTLVVAITIAIACSGALGHAKTIYMFENFAQLGGGVLIALSISTMLIASALLIHHFSKKTPPSERLTQV